VETLQRLAQDDDGFVVTIELILITTILVIGLIAGLAAVRDAVVSELSDVASSVQELNQSYRYSPATGRAGRAVGSEFSDRGDSSDALGTFGNCIQVYGVAKEQ
jgi:Flp pilus assembly pilin Flp